MNLELITIGTELLLGFTLDSNGAEIAKELAAIGVRVVRRTSVGLISLWRTSVRRTSMGQT